MDESKTNKPNAMDYLDTFMNPTRAYNANSNSISSVNMTRPTSLGTLVTWNISKALENNPTMNIKDAITKTQRRMEELSGVDEVQTMLSEHPCQRHLICAMLAWEQLGHKDADSLCRFVHDRLRKYQHTTKAESENVELSPSSKEFKKKFTKTMQDSINSSNSMGPVVKLPVETKVVMRLEKVTCSKDSQSARSPSRAREKDIMSKIDQACCLDSGCSQRLDEFDGIIRELRTRAGLLAKREAERVELLERAETAWRDLERGYQRRLSLAEEKEDDVAKQLQKVIEERNTHKHECTTLSKTLQEKTEKAEKDRATLQNIEKEVCNRACTRLKLSEEAAKGDALVAEQLCRVAQTDRDLQFKEEQSRRKVSNLESELESARALTHEVERALRTELASLRNQIEHVSKQLLDEVAENEKINDALKALNEEKMGMVEDLENCKILCDGRMQSKMDELKKKREQLRDLKEKEMECRCKLPIDVAVEVKRTPSLAALCKCSPEDKILDSCSCTSLRSTLLSNLLCDLFSGLQSEMGNAATLMPCQLLKCLEDKHNWDRASVVKTNLKDYFSKLLVGELDIAIATAIEKYHVKWVGRSCADAIKTTPKPGEDQTQGWQERAIEKRAQKLASQLAEQLFKAKEDELTQRAKEIVSSGPPPCECKPPTKQPSQATQSKDRTQTALYPCLTKSTRPTPAVRVPTPPNYWHQALQDVTQIKMQIEDLKKASIKKEDLKMMENKFTKIIQRAAGGSGARPDSLMTSITINDSNDNEQKPNKTSDISGAPQDLNKPILRKKCTESANPAKRTVKPNVFKNVAEKPFKSPKKNTPTYSVNMCLCSVPKHQSNKTKTDNNTWKHKVSKEVLHMSSSIKQTKPITTSLLSRDTIVCNDSETSKEHTCPSNRVCFHKIPSNTSIDQLLDTLAKWKNDLDASCSETPHKTCCLLNKHNLGCILDNNTPIDEKVKALDSIKNVLESSKDLKTCAISAYNSAEKQRKNQNVFKDEDCLNNLDENNTSLSQSVPNHKPSEMIEKISKNVNISTKSSGPMNNTESEYMGAINLEKSADEYCKCERNNTNDNNLSRNGASVYKCIHSSKCSCEKSFESKHLPSKSSLAAKKERIPEADIIHMKEDRHVNDSVVNIMTKNRSNIQDIPRKIFNKTMSNDSSCKIKFLGVTLSDANPQNTGDYFESNYDDIFRSKDMDENSKKERIYKDKKHLKELTKRLRCAKSYAQADDKRKSQKETLNGEILKIDERNVLEYNKISENQALINIKSEDCETYLQEDVQLKKLKDGTLKYNNDFSLHNENFDLKLTEENQFDSYRKKCTAGEMCKRLSPKQCDKRLEQLANLINNTLSTQYANVAIDTQSLTKNEQDQGCVCCDKTNIDETNNLEENAFNLLQEYLKNKLEEFKQSSQTPTFIRPDEEQKLFTRTLDRIKKLIYESTNHIACKCSAEQELTQGSWNRAYSLLQEYLKIKIQKVQCTCMLAEDNKDSILPIVLEKICSLIENDFQRLKDVCNCKRNKIKNKKKSSGDDSYNQKPDIDKSKKSQESCNAFADLRLRMAQDQIINTENNTNDTKDTISQVSTEFEMQTKSCSPMKIHSKNLQSIIKNPVTVHSVNTNRKYQYTPNINYSSRKSPSPSRKSSSPASKSPLRDKNVVTDLNSQKITGWNSNKINVDNTLQKRFNVTSKLINSSTDHKSTFNGTTDNDVSLSSNTMQKVSYMVNSRPIENVEPILQDIKMTPINVTSRDDTDDNIITSKLDESGPYIGCTIDCSCINTLETCVCSKSSAMTDSHKINNIWKNSIPDETYLKKVSYILNSRRPVGNITINDSPYMSEIDDDNYLKGILKNKPVNKNLSREICVDEDLKLKISTEVFPKSNMMTNTSEDNESMDTACSRDEDSLDGCGCCSTTNQSNYLENERLKNSIYFPAPITDFEDNGKELIANNVPSSAFHVQNKPCECDMVPICHVKMLVENIEVKLATAECTCDSLPLVCPVHSSKVAR